MVVSQYPDSVVVTVNVDATKNASGVWIKGSSTDYTFDCRAEPNGKGRRIAGKDGVLMDFSFLCYMPKTTTEIPFGSNFVLTTLNNGEKTGTVKRASNGQLNSRLWL